MAYELGSLISRVYEEQENLGLSIQTFDKENDEGTVEYKQ